MIPKRHADTAGFTLVEFAIVVPILIVTAIVLFDGLFAMIKSSTTERAQIDISYEKEAAVNAIESDNILASLYLPTNDATLTDPYTPTTNSGTWSYLGTSSTERALLMRVYSTYGSPLSSTRQPVFIGNPVGAECTGANIYFNDVQQYNVAFFIKNGNLYRRRLVDKTTLTCFAQYQKLSCPTVADLAAIGISPRNSSCDGDDELLAKNVTNFSINYYGTKTATTPLDVYAGGADPNLVTTAVDAEITLTINRTVSGQSITSTSTLRMSKLNTKPKGP